MYLHNKQRRKKLLINNFHVIGHKDLACAQKLQ